MAEITLANPAFYKDGSKVSSYVVGKETAPAYTTGKRIARYEFTAPAAGASSISFRLHYGTVPSGSYSRDLNFFIGTEANSHCNAGEGAEFTGAVSVEASSGEYTFTGVADIVLMPNTKYYLWIFPASNKYGYFYVDTASTRTLETIGTSVYALRIEQGTGTVISVTRNGEALASGATILHGDLLSVSFGAKGGYKLTGHTVNGADFASGDDHIVAGAVTVAAVAIPLAVRIGGDLYCIYIGTGGGKQMYVARIGRNGKWVPYPGA